MTSYDVVELFVLSRPFQQELPSEEEGSFDGGEGYRLFEQVLHFAVAALTAGTAGECVPAVGLLLVNVSVILSRFCSSTNESI
jgi:hypothetical protein